MLKLLRSIVFIFVPVFVFTIAQANLVELVSVDSTGVQGDRSSYYSAANADGRYVVFDSYATNLVANDNANRRDIFVRDRVSGTTERVSVDSSGIRANDDSLFPGISDDGSIVTFQSSATNLVVNIPSSRSDIYVHDRNSGQTERINVPVFGTQDTGFSSHPAISGDGQFVTFQSSADNLVDGDTNGHFDVFIHDRINTITERVSVSSAGEQADASSSHSSVSADGRYVVFESNASNLVANDNNGKSDIFIRDRDTGITSIVSVLSTGGLTTGESDSASISADGRYVAFRSRDWNLVEKDTNRHFDIFVRDRQSRTTQRINISSTGIQADDISYSPSISANGRFISFYSLASNLVFGDTNQSNDVFVHDRVTGNTVRVSETSTTDQAILSSSNSVISADGRFVSFRSSAPNLVEGDLNYSSDIIITENTALKISDGLSVVIRPTSATVAVGEYIRFRAKLINTTDELLTNCHAYLINPRYPYTRQRNFSFYSLPINVNNPILNGSIDLQPGESGQYVLALLPRVPMRREVRFNFSCDQTRAYHVPYVNTLHITAKITGFVAEDAVQLMNVYPKTELVIDRNSGNYWTAYLIEVTNNGNELASVNLAASTDTGLVIRPKFCEPVDPSNGNWACLSPRSDQLNVDLAAGEAKKIRMFVHAKSSIMKQPVRNRIITEVRDKSGKSVAKTSIGISTLN